MIASQFEKLIDKNKFQVFLLSCPAGFPLGFVRHPWFVLNNKGIISRYEVFWRPQKWGDRWGHLHKNFYPAFQGIAKLPFSEKYFWKDVKLDGYVEGDSNSMAEQMLKLIETSKETYPYLENYALTGINSNTYVQWILNHFPESGLKLPWNAFGKSNLPKDCLLVNLKT